MEYTEAVGAENQTEVVTSRSGWDVGAQADDIERPHLPFFDGHEKALGRDALAVVHVTFGGIIAQQAVDHDVLLAFREPAVLPPEPGLGLARTRGHENKREETDDDGDQGFDEEQPLPATPAVYATHVQDSGGHQGAHDVASWERGPKETQAERQLVRLVEVGHPEDNVGDEAPHGNTHKCLDDEEVGSVLDPDLGARQDGPGHNLHGNEAVGTKLLGHEAGGKLGQQERCEEDGLTIVEVVGVHS